MRRPPARLTRCVLSAVCCDVLAVTLDAQGQDSPYPLPTVRRSQRRCRNNWASSSKTRAVRLM